jgi:hypothetical protein
VFGVIARIRYGLRDSARLWFGDIVEVNLRAARFGSTSLAHVFGVLREGVSAVSGTVSIVRTAVSRWAGSQPWPNTRRRVFTEAGRQLVVEQAPFEIYRIPIARHRYSIVWRWIGCG